MNMMSYLPMATALERKVGSFQLFYATLLFTVINGMLHVTISELFHLNSCRFATIDFSVQPSLYRNNTCLMFLLQCWTVWSDLFDFGR